MYIHSIRKLGLRLFGVMLTLLLVGGIQTSSQAAEPGEYKILPGGLHSDGAGFSLLQVDLPKLPQAPTACHAVTGYANTRERTNFCVYYNAPTTQATADDVADVVEDYWDRYVNDFGFLAPLDTSAVNKIEVRIVNTADCNGSAWENYIQVYSGCFGSDENMMSVTGHELFHRVQFNYDTDWSTNWQDIGWLYEGTARASEDMVFNAVDNWAAALTADFSFNEEVNNYLVSTNADMTSFPMRYMSALWWKYFSEQFGATTTEPEVGIDTFLELWQNANMSSGVATVNQSLTNLGAGMNFNQAFRKFTVANYTKDLTGLPDDSYNYIDEEQAGNPDDYGPIVPSSGAISGASPTLSFTNRNVTKYGARYFQATIGANCPVVTASFHRDSGSDVFYHVVTQKGTAFAAHREGSGADWKQSFLNDGITRITAVLGGQANSGQADVTFSCANPVVDIKLPNSGAPANVWRHDNPQRFLAQILITDGTATGPVIAGLTNDDFVVKVNNIAGTIQTGGFIQEQYWLVVTAPAQAADGTYNLRVELQAPGTATEIASDTNANSIIYSTERYDHVLVIDRSGSMYDDDKLKAAQKAAKFYVDMVRYNDGLAVVSYDHNVDPTKVMDMAKVNSTVRTNAKTLINGLTPGGATSIGDGLDEAVDQRTASPTGWDNCSFVLLSDGMENSYQFWSDVITDVQGTNCPVTSIAFGPESDETLMQDIATETGGAYFYNDVYVSALAGADLTSFADMALALGNTYEYAQGQSEHRQRVLAEIGEMTDGQTYSHTVLIDDSMIEALFAINWIVLADNYYSFEDITLDLITPIGGVIHCGADLGEDYFFLDEYSGHMGCRVDDPEPGTWIMEITYDYYYNRLTQDTQAIIPPSTSYQAFVSGPSEMFMQLLLPDVLGFRFFTGDKLPIVAMIAHNGPISDAFVEAFITNPDGSETKILLFDDGQHGDGVAGDGFYGNFFTKVNQASATTPTAEDNADILPTANDEGSYSVRLTAANGDFQREALGGFSVQEGEDLNNNGVPDSYESQYGDPLADPDLDGLDTFSEYGYGTDPLNSDSDGGGENDYSETLLHGTNPFDPSDDQIEAPAFFQVKALNEAVQLLYDVKGEYTGIQYYMATDPAGPWTKQAAELPLIGSTTISATNGTTYYFRMKAYDGDNHWSAVVQSEAATPSIDTILPEAVVIINDGAASTTSLSVTLSFAPYEYPEPEYTEPFDDIAEVMISNSPSFDGATWQPFAQDIPWQLSASTAAGDMAHVYVRFKDDNDNVSIGTEVGSILYNPPTYAELIYLPIVSRSAP